MLVDLPIFACKYSYIMKEEKVTRKHAKYTRRVRGWCKRKQKAFLTCLSDLPLVGRPFLTTKTYANVDKLHI